MDIYEVLSPDYPTARADMIVEYVHHSFIHTYHTHTHITLKTSQLLIETSVWEIDRETVAKILSFVSKGLREIDLEKAREGQNVLHHSVTTSASKQMDMTKVTAASGEDIDEENELQEHTKIDLRLSLDLCDVRLRFTRMI